MAKPRKGRKKNAVVQLRVQPAVLQVIDQAAKAVGVTRSALIRHAAEAHARRVLVTTDLDDHATRPDSGRRDGWR